MNIDSIKNILLKNVSFTLNDKVVRKGRLLLYHQNDYYVKFVIQTNKNINKTYEVPYPYKVVSTNYSVIFSYLVSDFCRSNLKKEDFVNSITPNVMINKIHDRQLTIAVIDDA